MAFYTDVQNANHSDMCLGLEEGEETLCGHRDAVYEVTDEYGASIWQLVHNGRIHTSCDCKERLADHFGFPEVEAMERHAGRRVRAAAPGGGD